MFSRTMLKGNTDKGACTIGHTKMLLGLAHEGVNKCRLHCFVKLGDNLDDYV